MVFILRRSRVSLGWKSILQSVPHARACEITWGGKGSSLIGFDELRSYCLKAKSRFDPFFSRMLGPSIGSGQVLTPTQSGEAE